MFKFLESLLATTESSPFPFPFDREAIVLEVLQPGRLWRISFGGTTWYARCHRPLELTPGQIVYVVDRHNITLLIETQSATLQNEAENN